MTIANQDDIRQLGTILAVWAHPDDETFCAAGLLAAAVQNGQKVACLIATKGEAGVQDETRWPKEKLGEIREQELESALSILGIDEHHWLGYQDGTCHSASESEAVTTITDYIRRYEPDTIITFGPDGMTGHDDHKSVSKWASLASKKASKQPKVYHVVQLAEQHEKYLKTMDETLNIYFNIDEPKLIDKSACSICFELTPELKMLKYKALKAQISQTDKMMELFDRQFIEAALGIEAFVQA